MNAVILSFNPNKKQSVICERKQFIIVIMKCMGAVESESVKSARKAEDKACERQWRSQVIGIGRAPAVC